MTKGDRCLSSELSSCKSTHPRDTSTSHLIRVFSLRTLPFPASFSSGMHISPPKLPRGCKTEIPCQPACSHVAKVGSKHAVVSCRKSRLGHIGSRNTWLVVPKKKQVGNQRHRFKTQLLTRLDPILDRGESGPSMFFVFPIPRVCLAFAFPLVAMIVHHSVHHLNDARQCAAACLFLGHNLSGQLGTQVCLQFPTYDLG